MYNYFKSKMIYWTPYGIFTGVTITKNMNTYPVFISSNNNLFAYSPDGYRFKLNKDEYFGALQRCIEITTECCNNRKYNKCQVTEMFVILNNGSFRQVFQYISNNVTKYFYMNEQYKITNLDFNRDELIVYKKMGNHKCILTIDNLIYEFNEIDKSHIIPSKKRILTSNNKTGLTTKAFEHRIKMARLKRDAMLAKEEALKANDVAKRMADEAEIKANLAVKAAIALAEAKRIERAELVDKI